MIAILKGHQSVVQMLESDLLSQQKTAAAVRAEGERIISSQTSDDASCSTRDAMQWLNDGLAELESRLSERVIQMTDALAEVRYSCCCTCCIV